MVISSLAAAEVLEDGLGRLLRIVHTPMPDTVARLDTSHALWVLHLDPDSPPEDLCWAMLNVLSVLVVGPDVDADVTPTLRLLPGGLASGGT